MINDLSKVTPEARLARETIKEKYPLAYQDYLGNVWTDDLYNCDTHCICVALKGDGSYADFDNTWIEAARRVKAGRVL